MPLFTLPATADDYPESLKWWTGQIAGLDGDAVKNAVFVLAVLAFLAFVFGPHVLRRFRSTRPEPSQPGPTLSETLGQEIAAGEQLLREARQPDKLATTWQVDNLMRRGREWAERISAALAEHDEHERLAYWTRVPIWTAGRPTRDDKADVKGCIVDPLWERLQTAERFARELESEDAGSGGGPSRKEVIRQLKRHRDRVWALALSPEVDTWTYEQCRDVADSNEAAVAADIHLLCPQHARHWDMNRMMYPRHPPPTMNAHFRDRMRHTASQIDKVIADL